MIARMGRFKLLLGGIFAAIGLSFAASGGWFWYQDYRLASIGARAPGIVAALVSQDGSDSEASYRPTVVFTDRNGQEQRFTSRLSRSPAGFVVGEAVEVIYDPFSPDQAIIDSFGERHLFAVIFGGIGATFALVGLGILGWGLRRKRIIARLKLRGLPINADVLDCYPDTRIKVNGRSPWRVTCQAVHPATGTLQEFKSEHLWVNPAQALQGKKVRVLLDPANPKLHYVDMEQYLD